ncbi:MAG: thioredoxin family protein [Jejuia sp.]
MKKILKLTPIMVLLIFASAFTAKESIESGGYDIGDVVEDFSLKNINGNMVSLADYKDAKGFILAFTCNTCPFAIAYEDRIIALDKKYATKGYPVIAINPNNPDVKPGDDFKAMQQRAKEKGFTFPYLVDEGQKVYPKFGATKTPHNYVLQKTSKGLVVKYIGAIDDSSRNPDAVSETYLEDAVDALLNGEEIKVKKTKAIGCTIKV